MQLNDDELKRLIYLIISAVKSYNAQSELEMIADKKEVLVIFSAPWDNRFYTFTDEMKKKDCIFRGFVSPELPERAVAELRTLADWKSIVPWNTVCFENLKKSITVFPVARRETIVKTALCISDTFETKWIRAAMEQGGKIVFPRNGFERFTGLEPEKYRHKILAYYRDLLEMNIELPESFEKYIID